MKILIDIFHIVYWNFYKNIISLLEDRGIDVYIVVRPRGNLVNVIRFENPELNIISIGKHQNHLRGKIIDSFERTLELKRYITKNQIDAVTSDGFTTGFASKMAGVSSLIHLDDFEYKTTFYLGLISASKVLIPSSIPINGNRVIKYNGFKELAYLHPKYFKPSKKIISDIGTKEHNYVYLRIVSSSSLNYRQKIELKRFERIIAYIKHFGFDVVLSAEDKKLSESLRDICIVLDRPLKDYHSILKYAAFTISSGDSVARESCLVGSPCIYMGGRYMCANDELIKRGVMFKADTDKEIFKSINLIMQKNLKEKVEKEIDHAIKYDWDDVTEVTVDNLINLKKKEYILKN